MDRRSFIALGGTALLQSGIKLEAQQAAKPALPPRKHQGKPNILMIMADQLRFDCVGAYGNKAVHTPHLDRIAREGIRFQNAYSCTPSCTPARSALLTGLGPWRNGMLGYSDMSKKSYPFEKASALAAAGYHTTTIGKNHYNPINNSHGYEHIISDEHSPMWFGADNKPQPLQERCDYESWFWAQMPDKDPYATGLGWNDRTSKPYLYPEELHPTHWMGTTAVRFLEQYDRTEPFFLKVSFIRPHCPYDPPERIFKMYEDKPLPEAQVGDWAARYEPRSDKSDALWHGKLSKEEIRNSRQGYYASITHVDEQVGRMVAALEARGMLENTFIVFFSDHGDMLGDQNLWRKSYAYESSAHIPMLVRPAAGMQTGHAGRTITNPVEIRDLLPTFLDVAEAPIPAHIEGKSMLQLARGKSDDWREYIDLEHNVCYGVTNHWNGLTDGKWKYIFHAYDGEEQLFHLQADPHELHNLAAAPEHAKTLELWRARLVAHLAERGENWVKDGKLQVRKQGTMFSPNFPDQRA